MMLHINWPLIIIPDNKIVKNKCIHYSKELTIILLTYLSCSLHLVTLLPTFFYICFSINFLILLYKSIYIFAYFTYLSLPLPLPIYSTFSADLILSYAS